jgi:hypothetical protein
VLATWDIRSEKGALRAIVEALSVNRSVSRSNEMGEALENDLCTKNIIFQVTSERRNVSSISWNFLSPLRLIS